MVAEKRSSRVDILATVSDTGLTKGMEAPARFSLEEVAEHNSPTDCWVIVRRKVYDVTPWVPRHPGGDLIFVKAGRDCTHLFDSYHPLSTRLLLNKYYMGELDVRPGQEMEVIEYEEDLEEGQFFAVLKRRVDKYFRSNKINPRISSSMVIKSMLILGTVATSFYGAFFGFQSFALSLASAALLGFAMAEVGVSIQHDANHGAYLPRTWFSQLMGATLDMVGASSFMWRQQHVVGHHAFTNLDAVDPDLRVSDGDVRCVTPYHKWHPYQVYQHLYLGFLYGLLAIKSVLVDDFMALVEGAIGSVRIMPFHGTEAAIFWGGKALYAAWFVALPSARSTHSWPALVALWLTAEAFAGWTLAMMFQVAHVVGEVEFLQADTATGKVARGWAAAQVATSADFAHGSWFWTHVSGGLNYQVVHHLFPGVCHTHYPAIAPIVLDTCKEFDIPYQIYPTFWNALSAHFAHLKTMGSKGYAVPSLATIG